MMERIAETSPRLKARITGAFYLLAMLTEYSPGFRERSLVVDGDAAATATNILRHRACFSWVSQSTSSNGVPDRYDSSLL